MSKEIFCHAKIIFFSELTFFSNASCGGLLITLIFANTGVVDINTNKINNKK